MTGSNVRKCGMSARSFTRYNCTKIVLEPWFTNNCKRPTFKSPFTCPSIHPPFLVAPLALGVSPEVTRDILVFRVPQQVTQFLHRSAISTSPPTESSSCVWGAVREPERKCFSSAPRLGSPWGRLATLFRRTPPDRSQKNARNRESGRREPHQGGVRRWRSR